MTPTAAEAPPSDRVAELVARAKDIIHGRVPPPDIEIPESITRFYAEDLKDRMPPPNPKVIRHFSERNAMEMKLQGDSFLAFLRPDGFWSVLAEGYETSVKVFQALTGEEQSKTLLTDTFTGPIIPW